MMNKEKSSHHCWCLPLVGRGQVLGAVWWGFGEGSAGRRAILCNCFAAGFASVMRALCRLKSPRSDRA